MTTHYSEAITADQIIQGWRDHGNAIPMAYATMTHGDKIAYEVWRYMDWSTDHPKTPTPGEWFRSWPEDPRKEVIFLVKEVLSKWSPEEQ